VPDAAGFAAGAGLRLASFDAILVDPQVGAVMLCTPRTRHAGLGRGVAAGGSGEGPLLMGSHEQQDAAG